MNGLYERTDFHSERIREGISEMMPGAKRLQAERISESFIGREPRVFLDGLRSLWESCNCGHKMFRKIAVEHGYPDKSYYYTIKLFTEHDKRSTMSS